MEFFVVALNQKVALHRKSSIFFVYFLGCTGYPAFSDPERNMVNLPPRPRTDLFYIGGILSAILYETI